MDTSKLNALKLQRDELADKLERFERDATTTSSPELQTIRSAIKHLDELIARGDTNYQGIQESNDDV